MSPELGYRTTSFRISFTDPVAVPGVTPHCDAQRQVLGPSFHSSFPQFPFNTFYFNLMRDGVYHPAFKRSRGSWLEAKTADGRARRFGEFWSEPYSAG
jgi:hypothetical protein